MKLLRFGNPGSERPGVLDNDGRLRDLSQYINDLRGDARGINTHKISRKHVIKTVSWLVQHCQNNNE